MVWSSDIHIHVIFFYEVNRNDCITLNLHSTSPRMDGRTNQPTDKAGCSQKQVMLGHRIVADG